jgi:thiamine pyrophosphate-dependent acetolactate synthase large subunit-like protein
MPTGAQLLVRGLEAAGVEVAFGLPGVHTLPAWKAFAASSIRLVGVRHEQTAAYAADGYARATGRLGVAITTTGPGAANTLGAVGEAWASGSPILVITTDIPHAVRRPGAYRGALHETTDQGAMFGPVTKAALRVTAGKEIYAAVQLATFTARDAPSRPVYLEIPTDVLGADVGGGHLEADIADDRLRTPPEDLLDRAATLLDGAQRPLIWAGGGALRSQAAPEVAMVAEHLGAPVITTYQARGLLGGDHPCDVGAPPQIPQVGALWDAADVVLAVGTDFDAVMTQSWAMPPPPELVAVNVDEAEIGKAYACSIALVGDAAATLAALVPRIQDRGDLGAVRAQLDAVRGEVRASLARDQPDGLRFLDVFAEAAGDAVVVADMCIPGYWLGAFHTVPRPRALAYPVGWGTLGFAFPAALGSALAGHGPVISVSGDGGFLFACGELATMAQEAIPLTAVIVDDGGYGMLRYDQRASGDPVFGVDLMSPDFAALAASFGVEAETVEGLEDDFGAALARHVGSGTPSVLVAKAALEPPPSTSPSWYRRARP